MLSFDRPQKDSLKREELPAKEQPHSTASIPHPRNLRNLTSALVLFRAAAQEVEGQLDVVTLQYFPLASRTSALVGSVEFESGRLPVESIFHVPGRPSDWKVKCEIASVTISAYCDYESLGQMDIADDAQMSPETERYLRCLRQEASK